MGEDVFQTLEITSRCATRALPLNYLSIQWQLLKRIVWIVECYNMHPTLFVNVDEVGLRLVPSPARTLAPKGQEQVEIQVRMTIDSLPSPRG